MEFKKREDYSIKRNGFCFQISEDEFVHCSSIYSPKVITWIKGNKCTEIEMQRDTVLGVVGNSFFFEKDKIIKKAELLNDEIVVIDSVKIDNGIKVLFKWNSLHYFIERDNNANVSFAIPVNEDYRSTNGIKLNVSIVELKNYSHIHAHGNLFYCVSNNSIFSSIRRYQSDSEEYLEKKGLPRIRMRSVIFNNWILYLNFKGDLISVNMNDLSYDIMKTNLENYSNIVGIDENGMVNVQTNFTENTVHILSSKLREKYIISNWDEKK